MRLAPRQLVQYGFASATLLTGLHFHRFVISLHNPALPGVPRPAEVDAWLPISSYTSLVYWCKSGIANPVHPAGLVLFCLFLLMALTLRRGFCSWVCPIGTASELLHRLGARLLGRNLVLPKWLDYPLRAIKYLLLAFFLLAIGAMSAAALREFIYGPYNRICDLKMYALFAHPSRTTIIATLVLALLSLLIKNFWCRYLCPYGALLGLASLPAPLAVRRKRTTCIQCDLCTRACPNRIDVAQATAVRSAECTACLECLGACPVADTLNYSGAGGRWQLTPLHYGIITITAILLVAHGARALGYWESDASTAFYRRFVARLDDLAHPPVKGYDPAARQPSKSQAPPPPAPAPELNGTRADRSRLP